MFAVNIYDLVFYRQMGQTVRERESDREHKCTPNLGQANLCRLRTPRVSSSFVMLGFLSFGEWLPAHSLWI